MGVSLVGQGAIPKESLPIYITNTTPNTSGSGATTVQPRTFKTFIPKGAYTITLSKHGDASYGTSASGGYVQFNDIDFTIYSFEADTGRPGPVYMTHGNQQYRTPQSVFVLNKDSYVSALIYAPSAADAIPRYDIVFQPTNSQYTAYPTITGNRTQTATSNPVSGSSSDVNWGLAVLGWDYDNDSPFIITGLNPSDVQTNWKRIFTTFYIWRFSNSTGKWTKKQIDNISSTLTWYTGTGLYFHYDSHPQFFIKNNYIHNLTTYHIAYDASNYAWGWIKGDISGSGTTLTLEPGHSNNAFATLRTNILQNSASTCMMYFWDKTSGKVIYNGARSATLNGAWGVEYWRSYWSQWDIATNTVEYSNVNSQTADPRLAGSVANSNLVYNSGVACAADGFIYAVGANGTSEYLAKWDRTGTYTGIGNFSEYYPGYTSATVSLGMNSQQQKIQFLPYNTMVYAYCTTIEYNTGTNVPAAICDSGAPFGYFLKAAYGSVSPNTVNIQILLMPQGIFVMQVSYTKTGQDSGLRYTAPITVLKASMSKENLSAVIPTLGGLPSATYGLSGINDGTW